MAIHTKIHLAVCAFSLIAIVVNYFICKWWMQRNFNRAVARIRGGL